MCQPPPSWAHLPHLLDTPSPGMPCRKLSRCWKDHGERGQSLCRACHWHKPCRSKTSEAELCLPKGCTTRFTCTCKLWSRVPLQPPRASPFLSVQLLFKPWLHNHLKPYGLKGQCVLSAPWMCCFPRFLGSFFQLPGCRQAGLWLPHANGR